MNMTKLNLLRQSIVINAAKSALVEQNDSGLYQRLQHNYEGFAGCELISCHDYSADWPGWEMHPNGDEVIVLLSGEVTLVLGLSPQSRVELLLSEVGDALVIPACTWHTAKVKVPCRLLFFTPGEGTEHQKI